MADNNKETGKKETDKFTGIETTGHEWDGIKELNNPAPRWWLWTLYVCIIWAIGYWFFYPAWPTFSGENERGGTIGSLEWTQYTKLKGEQAEIVARRAQYLERFSKTSLKDISNDPELYAFAIAGGKSAFKDNCATCHGTGGAGAPGYPNLNDDDWIWGGSIDSIYQTIKYGIRMHDDGHSSEMPAYGEMLSKTEIDAVAGYVQELHGGKKDIVVNDIKEGEYVFRKQCAACHGNDGKGNREIGAPNLADAIWLKNEGTKAAIISQIRNPKHGTMPAWVDRLDDDTIRQLTIYVHSLGGGE